METALIMIAPVAVRYITTFLKTYNQDIDPKLIAGLISFIGGVFYALYMATQTLAFWEPLIQFVGWSLAGSIAVHEFMRSYIPKKKA